MRAGAVLRPADVEFDRSGRLPPTTHEGPSTTWYSEPLSTLADSPAMPLRSQKGKAPREATSAGQALELKLYPKPNDVNRLPIYRLPDITNMILSARCATAFYERQQRAQFARPCATPPACWLGRVRHSRRIEGTQNGRSPDLGWRARSARMNNSNRILLPSQRLPAFTGNRFLHKYRCFNRLSLARLPTLCGARIVPTACPDMLRIGKELGADS